jgi:hypothetical protein
MQKEHLEREAEEGGRLKRFYRKMQSALQGVLLSSCNDASRAYQAVIRVYSGLYTRTWVYIHVLVMRIHARACTCTSLWCMYRLMGILQVLMLRIHTRGCIYTSLCCVCTHVCVFTHPCAAYTRTRVWLHTEGRPGVYMSVCVNLRASATSGISCVCECDVLACGCVCVCVCVCAGVAFEEYVEPDIGPYLRNLLVNHL